VTRNDRQRERGSKRLAAARKIRSVVVNGAGASDDGKLVPKNDDLELLEVLRARATKTSCSRQRTSR